MAVAEAQFTWSAQRLTTLALSYLAAAGVMVALTRFDGGVACLWVATAVLVAALRVTPWRRWAAPVLACAAASALASSLFGLGPGLALPLAAVNVGEGIIAAALLNRWRVSREGAGSAPEIGALVLGAGLASAAGALAAATVFKLYHADLPPTSIGNWFFGHTLGTVTFMPIAMLGYTGALQRRRAWAGNARLLEKVILLLLVAATTAAVFAQGDYPVLFVPLLPVILATFRLGQFGAAASVVMIAVIGGTLTAQGLGPVYLVKGDVLTHVQFFQFYLGAILLSTLPVAAELTRRQKLYQRLRDSEARYRLITENSTDIVMNLDLDGTMRFVSPSITQLAGYTPEQLIGRRASELIVPDDREHVRAVHAAALAEPGRIFLVEYRALDGDGETHWFETHTRGVVDDDGSVVGAVSAIRDISDRKQREEELSRDAATDPLTDLVNRRAFNAELDRQIEAARQSGTRGCVALFDLDHFKRVNDTYGHEAGDTVLQCFAKIARGAVRDRDLVGRLGGEEFAVLLPGVTIEQARIVCERIRVAIAAARVRIAGHEIRVTVSVGVAPFDHLSERAQLLRAADAALYAAKRTGRNRLELAA